MINNINKKGFTLIELLAVIVVLAIVMLLAVQAVLPQMEIARKNSFAIEANAAIESAQSYFVTKALTDNLTVSSKNGLCITVDEMSPSFYKADTTKYHGYVKITKKENSNDFLYQVYLENGKYMANGLGLDAGKTNQVNIDGDDIVEYDSENFTGTPTGCVVASSSD